MRQRLRPAAREARGAGRGAFGLTDVRTAGTKVSAVYFNPTYTACPYAKRNADAAVGPAWKGAVPIDSERRPRATRRQSSLN